MPDKRLKPKVKRSERPTLTGNPPLGYLISYYCPTCGQHLFSHYEADVIPDEHGEVHFGISPDWNFCSRCGQHLDLDQWKHKVLTDDYLELED